MEAFNDTMSSLGVLGIESMNELGRYIAPSKQKLPAIKALEVQPGYLCRNCPCESRAIAYYCASEATMRKHISN
jgi:hypothetical protein